MHREKYGLRARRPGHPASALALLATLGMAAGVARAGTLIDDFSSGTVTLVALEDPELAEQTGEMVGGERQVTLTDGTLNLDDGQSTGAARVTATNGDGALTVRWGAVPSPQSPSLNLDMGGDFAIRLTFGPETRGVLQFNLALSTTGKGHSIYDDGIYATYDAGSGGSRFTLDLRFEDFHHDLGDDASYRVDFANVDAITLDLLGERYSLEEIRSVSEDDDENWWSATAPSTLLLLVAAAALHARRRKVTRQERP